MPRALRFPVAHEVDPARPLLHLDPLPTITDFPSAADHEWTAPGLTPTNPPTNDSTEHRAIEIVLHDGYRARHGIIAGPDRPGAEALIQNTVMGAIEHSVDVHYIAPTSPPPAAVWDLVELSSGPDVIRRPFRHWADYVRDRCTPELPMLLVVDFADLMFHRCEEYWFDLALMGAAVGVSILAVADRLRLIRLHALLANDNTFQLRSNNDSDSYNARQYLPGTDLQQLPPPDDRSYGIAGSASTAPTTFAVRTDRV